jgi:hypothetical protein
MNSVKGSQKAFPTKLVIGGVLVLLVIGVLVFLFVKPKKADQPSDKLAALQKIGGEKYKDISFDSTVKTKEEGIEVCKKSEADYCYPLVAVSFNDLSVCSQAIDRVACEATAKGLMEGYEISRETTSDSSQDSDLVQCKKDTLYESGDGKMAITGKEQISVDGKSYSTCCYETTDSTNSESDKITKSCMSIDGSEATIIYNKINGKYVIWGAAITSDGVQCNYIYTEEGTLESKTCL